MVKLTETNVGKEMKACDYIFKHSHWYLYKGGRKQFQKELQAQRVDQLSLTETKEAAEIWKLHNFMASPSGLVLLEQCVWLTLCIEWCEDAKIFFDYTNNKVKCAFMGMEITI